MPDSLHQYVSKLEVGQNPDAINKFPQTTLWNKVTLSSVRKRQFGSADTVLNAAIAHTTALAGSTCQNAVIEVQYTITHTNAGVVSSVSAAVVLADLVSSHGAVRQSFSVAYAGAAGSRYVKRRGLHNAPCPNHPLHAAALAMQAALRQPRLHCRAARARRTHADDRH